MGITIGGGSQFAEMLRKQSVNCSNCGAKITFEDGVECSRQHGIEDKVVMCRQCGSVFGVELTPEMVLTEDVTWHYGVADPPDDDNVDVVFEQKKAERAREKQADKNSRTWGNIVIVIIAALLIFAGFKSC